MTACAFLDIKSAFDSAWHPAILAALLKRKCPHYLFCLVCCFLADRTALLSHNDSDLSIKVNLGCPQGGVLSPFLCNVLIDDILRLRFPFPFLSSGYADDLTVATSHKDPHMATANLQLVCNAIVNWCAESKLTLNAIKTVFMLFSRKALDFTTLSLGLSIHDINIFPSKEIQFLGFILDYRLKWTPHIAHKVLKAKKPFLHFKNVFEQPGVADAYRLRFLIAATVDPIVLYGCSVWASFLNTKCGVRKLRAYQRSISISITKLFKSAPTDALLVIANIIPIDLRILQLLALRFRSNSMIPFVDSSFRWLLKHFPYGSLQSKFEPSIRSSSYKEHPWFWLVIATL